MRILAVGAAYFALIVLSIGYSLVANGFLAHAVAAATAGSEQAVRHVWKRRWFIDAALIATTIATLLLPRR